MGITSITRHTARTLHGPAMPGPSQPISTHSPCVPIYTRLLHISPPRRGEPRMVAARGDARLAQPLASGLGLFAREAVDLQGGW